MLQRQISIERDDTEEALEEPLKAKKRRESRQGRENESFRKEIKAYCALFFK